MNLVRWIENLMTQPSARLRAVDPSKPVSQSPQPISERTSAHTRSFDPFIPFLFDYSLFPRYFEPLLLSVTLNPSSRSGPSFAFSAISVSVEPALEPPTWVCLKGERINRTHDPRYNPLSNPTADEGAGRDMRLERTTINNQVPGNGSEL